METQFKWIIFFYVQSNNYGCGLKTFLSFIIDLVRHDMSNDDYFAFCRFINHLILFVFRSNWCFVNAILQETQNA